MTTSMPAFVRGAKKLLLLKLDGEPGFGIHEQKHHDAHGHPIWLVRRVDCLSPSDRAGIARGDQLLNVKVLGVDTLAYVWSAAALERIENLHEICVVEICVKKRDGTRISDLQLNHRDHISQWLAWSPRHVLLIKAKELSIASKRFRGAFIPSQLKRVVVLLYDYEHDYFARLWKALAEEVRAGIVLPVARAFVSETKLPGLKEERPPRTVASLPTTPTPTPPPSPARTDSDATIFVVSFSADRGHTEEEQTSSSPVDAGGSDAEQEYEPPPPVAHHRAMARLMTARTAAAERRRRRAQQTNRGGSCGREDDDAEDVVFVKVEPGSSSETPPTLAMDDA